MIEAVHGDLLTADVDALVNTVNTEGIMGKGVALQFKRAFPSNYEAYRVACSRDEVTIGRMFVTETGRLDGPRLIINFPTKRHWRSKSRLEDIEAGLVDLRQVLRDRDVTSVALPALGCGLGGLQWADVEPLIIAALADLDVLVRVFPPQDAPSPREMRDARAKPKLTSARAALIGLIARYVPPEEGATPLVVQKLLYFLQVAGEPLRLTFVRHQYGPYADAARHLVQVLEGHYLSGYGDGTGDRTVRLEPGAAGEAESHLAQHPETVERLERVGELIEGFETPYGLELLATTHWAAVEEHALDVRAVTAVVHEWSGRKERLFTPSHIAVAWQRLDQGGWLTDARVLEPA